MGRPLIDITGQHFGFLTAIRRTDKRGNGDTVIWECKCECGNTKYVSLSDLKRGNVKSCGCLTHTHNQTKTRLYKIWSNMKLRCYIPSATEYENYGGKGIKMCDEWLGKDGFAHFQEWAIKNGYNDTLTIDRKDNSKGYDPSNCKFSTYEEQLNNTSRNRNLTYNGKTQTMAQWAKELGMNYNTLNNRINTQKLSVHEAFTRPVNAR